jgi:tetratricopeptide (TPR) repeat protein
MAPEQAEGRIDLLGPATDVYGLGASLYEVLTGQPPFTGSDTTRVLHRVVHEAPAPPRSVVPGTPRALEAVCLKALAKMPRQRYATARELASEVQHFLAGEPTAAFPEPWTVRAGRWSRRHRTLLVAAGVLLMSAVVALSVSMALVWSEQKKTQKQKLLAEANYKLSREQSFQIIDLIESSEAEIAAVPALHKTRKAILVLASRACRRYLDEEPDDVDLRRRSAQVFRYTANVHRLNNESAAAEPLYRDAVRLYEALAEDFPDVPLHRQRVAETLRDQASLQSFLGRLREAEALLQRSIAIAEALLVQHPEQSHLRRTVAAGLLSLASIESTRGQYETARKTAQRAAALFRELAAQPPGKSSPYDQLLQAAALNIVARALRESGQLDAAYEAHKEPTRLAENLNRDRAGLAWADVLHFRAAFRLEQSRTWAKYADKPKRRDSAEKNMSATIQQWEGLSKNYPQVGMYRESLGLAYRIRGELRAEDARRREEARADFARAQKLLEQRVNESPQMPGPRGELGRTCFDLGQLARAANDRSAADWFAKAVSALNKAIEQSPDNAGHRQALAAARAALGK